MSDKASRFTLRWVVEISSWHPQDAEWSFLLSLLPAEEVQAVRRFKFRDDQKRALISRLLQRKCVVRALNVPFEAVDIQRTRGKKPFYAGGDCHPDAPNFNFNVSHEGDYVALASEPVCICGIDVAAPRQLRRAKGESVDAFFAHFQPQFTPSEWEAIRGAGADDESKESAFRQHWSLKEALVKVRGDGIAFDIGRAGFRIADDAATALLLLDGLEQPRWRFYLQELCDGHWLSVARGPPDVIVDAWGVFTKSLRRTNISEAEWQEHLNKPSPMFSLLRVADLVPKERLPEYADVSGAL